MNKRIKGTVGERQTLHIVDSYRPKQAEHCRIATRNLKPLADNMGMVGIKLIGFIFHFNVARFEQWKFGMLQITMKTRVQRANLSLGKV